MTIVPLSFVGSTTLVAGWKSITDIFWPLTLNPETSLQGYINVTLTAIIMVAAIVILIDSIRGWLGLRKKPATVLETSEVELSAKHKLRSVTALWIGPQELEER